METPLSPKAKLHPALWIAAIAVTLFSLVGIAKLTGLLPAATPAPPPAPPAQPVAEVPPAPAPVAAPAPAPTPEPEKIVVEKKEAKPAKKISYSSKPKANSNPSVDHYSSQPTSLMAPPPPPPCPDCGVVDNIKPVVQEGQASGLGAVAGGVVGAILGNQVGHGTGRDIARIAGIAGGAYAGHEIEKSEKSKTVYDVYVRMEDGTTQVVRTNNQPPWQLGEKVRIENGQILSR